MRGPRGPLRSGARRQSLAEVPGPRAGAGAERGFAGKRRRAPRVCRAKADVGLPVDAVPAPEVATPDAVESAAAAVGEAVAQGSSALDAAGADRLDGTSQILVSVLSTAAFALLFVLTLGVG